MALDVIAATVATAAAAVVATVVVAVIVVIVVVRMVAVIVVAVVIAADDAWVWSDAVDGWQILWAVQVYPGTDSQISTLHSDTDLLAIGRSERDGNPAVLTGI